MRKLLLHIIFLSCSIHALAQSESVFSTQYLNPQAHNPAFAGSLENKLLCNAHLRMQWVGMEGAPNQQLISAHMPIPNINSGIGLSIQNDLIGVHRFSSVSLDYNYRLNFKKSYLSIGIRPMVAQMFIDGSKIITPDGNYENNINHNDNILPIASSQSLLWDVGAGISYVSPKFQFGISMLNMLENKADISGIAGSISYQTNRTIFLQSTYLLDLNDTWSLQPNALFYTNLTIHQSEIGINCLYKHNIFIGTALKGYNKFSIEAVDARIGLKFGGNYQLGYQYEFGISGLRKYTSGSHELYLSYALKSLFRTQDPKIIYNPRMD